MKRILMIGFSFGLLATHTAQAVGPYLEVTGFPGYAEGNEGALGRMGGNFDGTTLNSETGFSYDLRTTLGVRIFDWVMIGGSYDYAKTPSKRGASAAAPSQVRKLVYSEWGATLGFFVGDLRVLGSYLFAGKKRFSDNRVNQDGTVVADSVTTNENGHGFQVIVGYSFQITPAFRIGPSLVYRRVIYSKQTAVNNVDPLQNRTDEAFSTGSVDAALLPMVTLIFSIF